MNQLRFLTSAGDPVPAVTADQMREIDCIAIEETGPNLYQMMENAGRNLAELTMDLLGSDWQKANIIVLAGSGGNGGGGICAARHLANRYANVFLCLASPDRLGKVPAFQHKTFRSTTGKEVEPTGLSREHPDLIVDALIGYGLTLAPQGVVAELVDWANSTGAPTLALDVPSGVDATTGDAPGVSINARWTMTLALPKTGLLPARTGQLFLADIGIPEGAFWRLQIDYVEPLRIPFPDSPQGSTDRAYIGRGRGSVLI